MSEPFSSTEQVLQLSARLFVDPTVPVARGEELISSVAAKLRDHPDHTAIVVGDGSRLIGLVSDSDVVGAITRPELAERVSTGQLAVTDIMTQLDANADTVAREDEPLGDVIERLNGRNRQGRPFQSLPLVTNDGRVLGQISRASIQRSVDEILRTK